MLERLMTPNKRRFAGAVSWSVGAYSVARLGMLFCGMEVSRAIGVRAFADFTFFVFSSSLLAAFSDLGISVAITKFGVLTGMRGQRDQSLRRLAAALQLSLAMAVLCFCALLAFTRVGQWPAWQIGVLAMAGLCSVWQVSFAAVLVALGELKQLFGGSLLYAVCILGGTFVSAGYGSLGPVLVSVALSNLLQCAWQARVVHQQLAAPVLAWFKPSLQDIRGILGLLSFLAPTSAIASSLAWLTVNIELKNNADPLVIGVFGASMTLFGMAMIIPSRVGQLVFVDQVKGRAQQRGAHAAWRADLFAIAFGLLGAIGGVAVLSVLNQLILGRFGAAIAGQWLPVLAFVAIAIVASSLQPVGSRIVAAGWQSLWMFVVIVQAAVTLSLLLRQPVTGVWLPVTAYWSGYLSALVVALPCYAYAVLRPRE